MSSNKESHVSQGHHSRENRLCDMTVLHIKYISMLSCVVDIMLSGIDLSVYLIDLYLIYIFFILVVVRHG